jgi:RNA polymerase sigma-70 factor (ECF subfamily)
LSDVHAIDAVVAAVKLGEPAATQLKKAVQSMPAFELGPSEVEGAVKRLREHAVNPATAAWQDLLLAQAALNAVPGAWDFLRRTYSLRIGNVFRRVSKGSSDSDVEGHFWASLGAATQGDTPLLSRYAGKGALGPWLVVTATRMAQKARERNKEDVTGDAQLFERVAVMEDELKGFRDRHRPDFAAAVKAAFSGLSPKERNLLRHHYLDGVETPGLGKLYGVHRATALRWLDDARESFVQAFRDELGKRLKVPRLEVDSIARLFRSQLDMSLPLEWSDADLRRK